MTEKEFEEQCGRYGIELPDGFYQKYKKFIAAWEFDDDFYLFLYDFSQFEEKTICAILRFIRQNGGRIGYERRIWWATKLAESMAKKMDKKLREYKSVITLINTDPDD